MNDDAIGVKSLVSLVAPLLIEQQSGQADPWPATRTTSIPGPSDLHHRWNSSSAAFAASGLRLAVIGQDDLGFDGEAARRIVLAGETPRSRPASIMASA